jgi:hypothetical protein
MNKLQHHFPKKKKQQEKKISLQHQKEINKRRNESR